MNRTTPPGGLNDPPAADGQGLTTPLTANALTLTVQRCNLADGRNSRGKPLAHTQEPQACTAASSAVNCPVFSGLYLTMRAKAPHLNLAQ